MNKENLIAIKDLFDGGLLKNIQYIDILETLDTSLPNKDMMKKDLKNGFVLKTRDGSRYLYVEGKAIGDKFGLSLKETRNDLTNEYDLNKDIVEIYVSENHSMRDIVEGKDLTEKLIWKRKSIKESQLEATMQDIVELSRKLESLKSFSEKLKKEIELEKKNNG